MNAEHFRNPKFLQDFKVEAVDDFVQACLLIAAQCSDLDTFCTLVEQGANPDGVCGADRTRMPRLVGQGSANLEFAKYCKTVGLLLEKFELADLPKHTSATCRPKCAYRGARDAQVHGKQRGV
jgi:hypothetical protein